MREEGSPQGGLTREAPAFAQDVNAAQIKQLLWGSGSFIFDLLFHF